MGSLGKKKNNTFTWERDLREYANRTAKRTRVKNFKRIKGDKFDYIPALLCFLLQKKICFLQQKKPCLKKKDLVVIFEAKMMQCDHNYLFLLYFEAAPLMTSASLWEKYLL